MSFTHVLQGLRSSCKGSGDEETQRRRVLCERVPSSDRVVVVVYGVTIDCKLCVPYRLKG